MNHKPEQFADMVKHIRLSDEERERMRAVLQTYIRQSVVREVANSRQLFHAGFFRILSLSVSKSMIVALIIALSLALGGGVSLAAEQALPGDALYTVKIRVNEEVREALSLSAQDKADWETRRAERRLEEAEQLAVEGRLDEEVRGHIEEQFREHAEKVRERVKKFQEDKDLDSAVEVSARLEVSLRAHEYILSRLEEQADGQAETLRLEVKKEHKESEDLDDDVKAEASNDDDEDEDEDEDAADRQEAAVNKLKSAQHKIDEVRSFIGKSKASDETKAEGEKRLLAAEKSVSDGQAKVTAEDYNGAFLLASDAHRLAQEVKLFVAAEQTLSVRMSLEKSDDRDEEEDLREKSRDEESVSQSDDDDEDGEEEEQDEEDDDKDDEDEDEDDKEDDDEEDEDDDLEVKVKIRR